MNCPAEVVTGSLLIDDSLIYLARRGIIEPAHRCIEEALVVPKIEVGLCAVVGDIDFAMLVGVHRPRIDVDVRVELHDGDAKTASLQDRAE